MYSIEDMGSNFPVYLRTIFLSQAEEIARKCIMKPLKKSPKWEIDVIII